MMPRLNIGKGVKAPNFFAMNSLSSAKENTDQAGTKNQPPFSATRRTFIYRNHQILTSSASHHYHQDEGDSAEWNLSIHSIRLEYDQIAARLGDKKEEEIVEE